MRCLSIGWLPVVACLSIAFALVPPAGICPAGEPASAQKEIDELISQLGSEKFEVREAATRRLSEREDAIAALRLASKSKDAEVARRARELLDLFVRKEKERAFAKLSNVAKDGAVDQAVERLVRREKWDNETACWQVMAELAGKLTDLELKTYEKASLPSSEHVPARDFRRFFAAHSHQLKIISVAHASSEDLKPTLKSLYMVVRAEEIAGGPPTMRGLFISSGAVKGLGVSSSVIFAGGSVVIDNAFDSLIVCDGDFTARIGVINSLVIARGIVRCPITVDNSRIISSKDIKVTHPKRVFDSKLVENEPKPLGFIKFFDPTDVGIKVESADGGVRVRSAEKGKPFATAGVRADDLITTVNGQAVKDAESFRRLLRAGLAVDGDTVLKVRRDKQVREVRVPAPK